MPAVRKFVRACAVVWAAPTSAVAVPLLALNALSGGETRLHTGVLEAHGPFLKFLLRRCTLLPGGASAITLGHIVIGRDAEALERTRDHERVHVCQAERWGPLFLPAYAIASLLARAKGGDAYRDNVFEREAFASPSISSRRSG